MIKAESHSLIYIVISIILLIISSIGKNRNKKQLATPPSEEGVPAPPTTWQQELEDVFTKMSGEEPAYGKTTPKQEQVKFETLTTKVSDIETKPSQANVNQTTAAPFRESVSNAGLSFTSRQEENLSVRNIDMDENEIRKAIIYSEIINRKYF
jgi:hypothetical protein